MNADMEAISLMSESLATERTSMRESFSLKADSCRSLNMSSTFTGPRIDVDIGGGGC